MFDSSLVSLFSRTFLSPSFALCIFSSPSSHPYVPSLVDTVASNSDTRATSVDLFCC